MNNAPSQANTSGPNQTWDYSLTTFNSLEDSGRYINITSTFSGWNYNFAYHFITPGQPKYEFYQLSSLYLRYAGYARADIAIDTLILATPSVILPVPINFGDSLTEPITGHYINGGFPISLSGNTHLIADAYGTVILPWATYSNVLRVHVTDTLSLFGQHQTNSTYYYYDTSQRYPILVIYDKAPAIGYTTRLGILTSRTEAQTLESPHIFPNPASDRIYLQTQTFAHHTLRVNLYTLTGQHLKDWLVSPGNGYEAISLDLPPLATGLYLLQIDAGKAGISRKKLYIK
ncbi:MAG TPA: T9SS type A sorting domain-containing protein [Bacteroidetes bacterium]|nr:T9SS type A sorting domain-containing protein [Bacteroidota bacterium]